MIENSGEIKQKEYLMLREETQNCFKWQKDWSTFSLTAVITIIGFALNLDKQIPEMYLLPYVVLLIATVKVHNLRERILMISSYMIERLECMEGFNWEHSLNAFREKHYPSKRFKFISILETQEFTFMGTICLIMFIASGIDNEYIHIRYVAEMLVAFIMLLFIFFVSKGYFSFTHNELQNYADKWKVLE